MVIIRVLQRSLLHEVPPKRRQFYTIRLHGVTFQMIALREEEAGGGQEEGEECDDDTEWRNLE
jgi:hypothetical protein